MKPALCRKGQAFDTAAIACDIHDRCPVQYTDTGLGKHFSDFDSEVITVYGGDGAGEALVRNMTDGTIHSDEFVNNFLRQTKDDLLPIPGYEIMQAQTGSCIAAHERAGFQQNDFRAGACRRNTRRYTGNPSPYNRNIVRELCHFSSKR